MKKIVLALCAASMLFGASRYDYELTPLAGYGHSSDGTKDEVFYGFRLGRNIDWSWLSQIELGAEYSPSVKYKKGPKFLEKKAQGLKFDEKTDIYRVYLDFVKLWKMNDIFGVYGLVGAGWQGFTKLENRAENHGFAQAGLGLRFDLTDRVALKLEARELVGFKYARDKQLYTLGIGFGLGERYTAPAVASPAVATIGDEDGDGVLDNVDRCPGTPRGHVVDKWGCEKVIRLDLGGTFKTNSSEISVAFDERIQEVAKTLVANPDYKVILEGHTDSTGSAEYNQKLSERRAIAVANALQKYGVDATRITAIGYGETRPIATNDTKEGRAQNRRVDAKFRNQ